MIMIKWTVCKRSPSQGVKRQGQSVMLLHRVCHPNQKLKGQMLNNTRKKPTKTYQGTAINLIVCKTGHYEKQGVSL